MSRTEHLPAGRLKRQEERAAPARVSEAGRGLTSSAPRRSEAVPGEPLPAPRGVLEAVEERGLTSGAPAFPTCGSSRRGAHALPAPRGRFRGGRLRGSLPRPHAAFPARRRSAVPHRGGTTSGTAAFPEAGRGLTHPRFAAGATPRAGFSGRLWQLPGNQEACARGCSCSLTSD